MKDKIARERIEYIAREVSSLINIKDISSEIITKTNSLIESVLDRIDNVLDRIDDIENRIDKLEKLNVQHEEMETTD